VSVTARDSESPGHGLRVPTVERTTRLWPAISDRFALLASGKRSGAQADSVFTTKYAAHLIVGRVTYDERNINIGGESVSAHIAVPHGIAVLDIHEGRWAWWQVSMSSAGGPLRASPTNAIVTEGFDGAAFDCVSYNRPVLLSERALIACREQRVLDSVRLRPDIFLQDCESWVSALQQTFWDENDRRLAHNLQLSADRKAAKAVGAPVADTKRLAPLQDIDWPAPPPSSAWESDAACTRPVSEEALRIARGCIRLLNYWLDIESYRTRKNRSYLHDASTRIRPWPSPAIELSMAN
jgi:hypothetical protein